MFRIGCDPDFGNFKVACADSGGVRLATVPSVVGVGETDLGLLGLGDLGRRRRQAVPDKVAYGGVTYLVGEGVARFARPVQRMDFLRLSDGPELRALFYAAMYRFLRQAQDGVFGAGSHEAAPMVGLPVEVRSVGRPVPP